MRQKCARKLNWVFLRECCQNTAVIQQSVGSSVKTLTRHRLKATKLHRLNHCVRQLGITIFSSIYSRGKTTRCCEPRIPDARWLRRFVRRWRMAGSCLKVRQTHTSRLCHSSIHHSLSFTALLTLWTFDVTAVRRQSESPDKHPDVAGRMQKKSNEKQISWRRSLARYQILATVRLESPHSRSHRPF